MIYLVGGSSHVGKTYFAQKLMERHAIPYISLDHLKMMFIRGGLTQLTANDDYEMRYFLWKYVAEIIKTAIENEQQLIIEGCYIPSEWRDAFNEEYLKSIRCVFITMSEAYIRDHAEQIEHYADVIEHRISDEINPERLINCSREFREEAAQTDTPVLDIDQSFDEMVILHSLEAKLGI